MHDLSTGSTTRVGIQGQPLIYGAGTRMGNISNTGLFTAFTSYSRIMSGYDPSNYFSQVYGAVGHDVNEVISLSPDGFLGNDYSKGGAISDDGNYVAFISRATNLTADQPSVHRDRLYLRDRITNTTTKINVDATASDYYVTTNRIGISADGRFVLFSAGLLYDFSATQDHGVFLYDRMTDTSERVDISNDGAAGNGSSFVNFRSLTSDGRYGVFASDSDNLSAQCGSAGFASYVFDRITDEIACVATEGLFVDTSQPAISANGEIIVFWADDHIYIVPNPLMEGVVGYPDSDKPGLSFVDDAYYRQDVVLTGRGVHPNKGVANEDELTFKISYTAPEASPANMVQTVITNQIDFNTQFHNQHLTLDENAVLVVGDDGNGLPAGETFVGSDRSFPDGDAIATGDSVTATLTRDHIYSATATVMVSLSPLATAEAFADIKFEALDADGEVVGSTTLRVPMDFNGPTRKQATLPLSASSEIHQLRLSAVETTGTTLVIQEYTLTARYTMENSGDYFATSGLFPKGEYTYYFTASATDGQQVELKDNLSFTTGYSSVAFLPGHQASRLYQASNSDRIWEPDLSLDLSDLQLSSTTGESLRSDIYTKDIIDESYTELQGFNIYKKFELFMHDVVQDDVIHEWKALPYDWRLDFDSILTSGKVVGQSGGRKEISYLEATTTPYVLQELARMVEASDSGKVTFVTHSNGGLLVKYLTAALSDSNHPLYGDPIIAKYRPVIDSVEEIIMVAAPQVGTPKAVEALLHGDETEMVRSWGFLMDEEQVRELGENMVSTYNLLPSAKYFDIVQTPVVGFKDDVTEIYDFPALYGNTIDNHTDFTSFLLGDDGARTEPSSEDQDSPNVLKAAFLERANSTHDTILDNWQAPEHIDVTQVAGWGIPTISGIVYDDCDILFCPDQLSNLDRQIKMTQDGDGTVVLPSAIAMGADEADTWFVDIRGHNKKGVLNQVRNRDHSNILEIDSLQDFILSSILQNKQEKEFVFQSEPLHDENDIQLGFRLHSPVEIHLYNEQGVHTGLIPSPLNSSNVRFYEAQLPNSYYQELGEVKYAGADADTSITMVLKGEAVGTFTLEIEETRGDEVLDNMVFTDVPVTPETTGSLLLKRVADIVSLQLDTDGDGDIDTTITPDGETGEETPTIEEQFALIKTSIENLNLKKGFSNVLTLNLTKAEQYYKKEQYNRSLVRLVLVEKSVKLLNRLKVISPSDTKQIIEALSEIEEEIRGL